MMKVRAILPITRKCAVDATRRDLNSRDAVLSSFCVYLWAERPEEFADSIWSTRIPPRRTGFDSRRGRSWIHARTMSLVGGFSRESPPPPHLCILALLHRHLIGSLELDVKNHPDLSVSQYKNTARQFGALCLEVMAHSIRVAVESLSCEFIGCCPAPGSYENRKVIPCESAIGSEAWLAGLINCDPIAKMFVHWLLPHKVNSVTSHLAVWRSLLVSLQVCYWLSVIQGVPNKLRSNYKVNISANVFDVYLVLK
ncbi:hypothetical protein PR048_027480 [Dryococelus australis]|uniref:Uncharacterized protein n=1 Tax=Dryococelus australis TaxID=614101 RepID=A0ABQ9GFK8_9NEOP|nr:hypothetical protein PR048_027480 [Dryococelus australis]